MYHLAKAGWSDCLLLEKNELTAGSTWHAAGNVPTGKKIVITVTGHGLKDPDWALKTEDGTAVTPTKVGFDVVSVASALGLA